MERQYAHNLYILLHSWCLLLFIETQEAKAYSKIDSSKVALDSLPYFFNDNFSNYHLLDTGLNESHRYNPIYRSGNFYTNCGHITLPSRNVFYKPEFTDALNFSGTAYDALYLNNNDVQFMHSYYPITIVNAVIGSKKEQVVELMHSQQIVPSLNVGFKINGIRTAGYYNKQQSNTIAFQAFSSYLAPNGRYRSFFSYTYNRIAAQLNGGLQPDSSFSYAYESLSDKALIPVYLNNASHLIYGSDVYTKQQFGLDRKLSKAEIKSLPDTSASLNKVVVYARYQEYFRHHQDQFVDSTYYQQYLITQDVYKDKIRGQKTKASVSLQNTIGGKAVSHYLGYELQAGIENLDVTIINYKKNYFSSFINGALSKHVGLFHSRIEGTYYLNGFNQSNYQAVIRLGNNNNKVLQASFNAGANSLNPDVINNYYTSNNFFWEKAFKPVNTTFFNVSLSNSLAGNLFMQWNKIQNYVFFDSLALPTQLNTSVSLIQLKYYKLFKWKALRFVPEVLLQFDNSKEQYLGLPQYYTKTSLYFEQRIFKKHLWFQIGTDIFWLNSYKPYTYMAATNQFFYQSQFTTGNLPLLDFFLAFKVSKVKAFLRLEQLNTIITEPYFYTPYYAMPGFTFKLGINWMFIN